MRTFKKSDNKSTDEIFNCKCGGQCSLKSMSRHNKTFMHIGYLNAIKTINNMSRQIKI